MRTFEDFTAEATFALPSQPVTRADIIAFAAEFDPQPFHLAEPPPDAMVGGLIASGWHVCAILMRMLCDGLLLGR